MKRIFLIIVFGIAASSAIPQETDIVRAIQGLRPGAEWTLHGNSCTGLQWHDKVQIQPTCIEIANAIAALDPIEDIQITTILDRFTDSEYLALRKAAESDAAIARWFDATRPSNSKLNVNEPKNKAAKASLISKNVLTKQRADEVFAKANGGGGGSK